MELYQLGTKESGRCLLEETNIRYIDAENDIYPPLKKEQPSKKIIGSCRLLYAIFYLQAGRVRQLLIELCNSPFNPPFDLFNIDTRGNNIIGLITHPNFPTNLTYPNNKSSYESLFFVILETLQTQPHLLQSLFNHLITNTTSAGWLGISSVFGLLSDRPHLLLALWNYGLIYNNVNVEGFEYLPLKHMLNKTSFSEFIPKKRYYLLTDKCPISMQLINRPAILTDGVVYEYCCISKHLLVSDNNPMTNQKLSTKSQSNLFQVNNEWVGEEISTKILYLPEENRFVHFNFIS